MKKSTISERIYIKPSKVSQTIIIRDCGYQKHSYFVLLMVGKLFRVCGAILRLGRGGGGAPLVTILGGHKTLFLTNSL